MENPGQKNAQSFTEGGDDDDDDDDIIVYFPKHAQNNAATKEKECMKYKDKCAANSTVLPWTRRRR